MLNFLYKITALNGAPTEEVSCLTELIKAGEFIVLFVGHTDFFAGGLCNVHCPGLFSAVTQPRLIYLKGLSKYALFLEVAVEWICISKTEQVDISLTSLFSFQGGLLYKLYSKTMKSIVLKNDNKGFILKLGLLQRVKVWVVFIY